MADLLDIPPLWADDSLKTKVEAAITVVAQEIEGEDPATTDHAKRLALAKKVYENSNSMRDEFLKAMVAANNTATTAAILAASDATILTNVRAAWDTFLE